MSLPDDAKAAFMAAVAAIDPTRLVKAEVRRGSLDDWFGDRDRPEPIHVLAVGKAASRMVWGLVEANVPFSGIGVATPGQTKPALEAFTWHVGGHPVVDERSFAAGHAVLSWADGLPPDAHVLVLLSGGASACMEAGPDPGDTIAAQRAWLRESIDIETLNRRRREGSDIKGGALGRRLMARTPNVRVWLLADTPRDVAQSTVGSGPCDTPDIPHHILAGGEEMVAAAGAALREAGYEVYAHGARIRGPVEVEVDGFLGAHGGLGAGAALIACGEPTIEVPADAGPGGRCQHAALVAARRLATDGSAAVFFAGASDGVDGTTREAGAWVDGRSWDAEAAHALAAFDASGLLSRRGRALRVGVTGTNAGDLWIAMVGN